MEGGSQGQSNSSHSSKSEPGHALYPGSQGAWAPCLWTWWCLLHNNTTCLAVPLLTASSHFFFLCPSEDQQVPRLAPQLWGMPLCPDQLCLGDLSSGWYLRRGLPWSYADLLSQGRVRGIWWSLCPLPADLQSSAQTPIAQHRFG